MGFGMIVIVSRAQAESVLGLLRKHHEHGYVIQKIEKGQMEVKLN